MNPPYRILVTGRRGQVVSALRERAAARRDLDVIALGRPALDLAHARGIEAAITACRPDAIVSAAAYTAVDQAETDEAAALAVNAVAPGLIGRAAARLGVPVIHLSTDYVFDGAKPAPYVEDDAVGPLGVYGRSKLAGELALAAATPDHVILRTAWVYSPFGRNFVRTMLTLARERDEVAVVADQVGNPTSALDIADGILRIVDNLRVSAAPARRGIFHMAGAGACSWADFARAIFARSALSGGPAARVRPIPAADYPAAAPRPAHSQLDCGRLAAIHGVRLPPWPDALGPVVDRLVGEHGRTEGGADVCVRECGE